MGFLLDCPNCGKRNAYEFRFGGEIKNRPGKTATQRDWAAYSYIRDNAMGLEKEWWYHRLGCKKWLIALRDTRNNAVLRTFWPGEE